MYNCRNDCKLPLHCAAPQRQYSGGSGSSRHLQNQTQWLRRQLWAPVDRDVHHFEGLKGKSNRWYVCEWAGGNMKFASLTAPQAGEPCVTPSTRAKGGGGEAWCSIASTWASASSRSRLAFSRACSLCRASSISTMMALWSFCKPGKHNETPLHVKLAVC